MRFHHLKLQYQVVLPVAVFMALVVFGGALWTTVNDARQLSQQVTHEAQWQARDTLQLLEVIDTLTLEQTQAAMRLLQERGAALGQPRRLPQRVDLRDRNVPSLYLGDTPMTENHALVDAVTATMGGTATLFVRDGDDFIRVTTNVINQGQRAIGTLLAPQGRAIAEIRQGRAYYGLVDILGEPYLTGYEPMRSAEGEVIGIWYVGFKLDMQILRERMADSRLLQTGFIALLDSAQRIRFHSRHLDAERIQAILADPMGWNLHSTAFPSWDFMIIAAYPERELQALAWAQAWRVGLASVLVALILVGILFLMVRRLVVRPIHAAVAASSRIAAGRFDCSLDTQRADELGEMFRAISAVQASVQRMAMDARRLATAAVAGQLAVRAELEGHQGTYREIIAGVNTTLDALIQPVQTAAATVEQIAYGRLPQPLTADYQGDFVTLQNNLNQCIEAIQWLLHSGASLNEAVQAGQLQVRADATTLQGDYQRIIEGFNQTLNAVTAPLEAMRIMMLALREGDLTGRLDGHYAGDLRVLQEAVNASLEQLSHLVTGMTESAHTIRHAAHDIAAGNADLSRRTELQASHLAETAASLADLTQQVRKNAEHAQQADQLAQAAHTLAATGADKARQAMTSMQAIESSTQKMGDIISVIDGIAFQTNILALNASVEAARAGEQGRGFAVVATEVRNLAQRSASAAREIRALLSQDTQMVSSGSQSVLEAGEQITAIEQQVQQVSRLIAEIANASEVQRTGIEQVNTAIAEMDEATQQNAALVEQAAAATESLEKQTEDLLRAAQVFRT